MRYTGQVQTGGWARVAAAVMFLMSWAALMVAGDTPAGRFLSRVMVEMPARAVNHLERGHIALAIVVTMLVVLHVHAGDGDPVRMVSLFAPDVLLWFTSIETSVIVEASAGIAAVLAASRRAGVVDVLAAFSGRPGKAGRARSGRRRNRTPPANDDDEGAGFALAG